MVSIMYLTLQKCTQVGFPPELKQCPPLGEKPVCTPMCSRKVQNTTKHPTGVNHINSMQVDPFLSHSGTLKGKNQANFDQKMAFRAPVIFCFKTQKMQEIFSYLFICSMTQVYAPVGIYNPRLLKLKLKLKLQNETDQIAFLSNFAKDLS